MMLRPRRTPVGLAVASALLTVCVLGSGVAAALPAPAASASPTWAYGALSTVALHGVAGRWIYSGTATYGFSTIFNETRNASNGVIAVELDRTIGARIAIRYCLVACASDRTVANFSFDAYATTLAWANLTTRGNVTEGGVPTPALALMNSHVAISERLRESGLATLAGAILHNVSFEVNVSGHVAVALAPALGLVPLGAKNLTPGARWNSTSDFSASGSAAWQWAFAQSGSLGVANKSSGSGTRPVSASGTISVNGTYTAGTAFGYGGALFPAVELNVTGPFALQEGAVLIPTTADLFSPGNHPWTPNQEGRAVVTTSRLDVRPGAFYRGHLAIVSSGFAIDSATGNVAATAALASAGPLPSAVPATTANNSTFVQGEPESVGSAQSDQNCLTTGIGCSSPLGPRLPIRLLFLAGAGTIAVAAIGLVVVSRRRPPAPVYPNSRLYPPGASAPAVAPPTNPPPKPDAEDPLSHLW